MRFRHHQKGAGNIGCLFSLVLISIFIFICYRVIPIYYHASEFKTAVELEVERAGAKYYSDDLLRRNIMNLAKVYEIPLIDKDLQIVRAPTQLAADVKYVVKVDFAVYTQVFNFQFRAKSIVGTL